MADAGGADGFEKKQWIARNKVPLKLNGVTLSTIILHHDGWRLKWQAPVESACIIKLSKWHSRWEIQGQQSESNFRGTVQSLSHILLMSENVPCLNLHNGL